VTWAVIEDAVGKAKKKREARQAGCAGESRLCAPSAARSDNRTQLSHPEVQLLRLMFAYFAGSRRRLDVSKTARSSMYSSSSWSRLGK